MLLSSLSNTSYRRGTPGIGTFIKVKYALKTMNAFDRHSRNFSAQCEECEEVFDILPIAKMHSSTTHHKIKVTEFWIIGRK
jgi:hypothetical protein